MIRKQTVRIIYVSGAFVLFFVFAIRSVSLSQKKGNTKSVIWKETIGTLDPHGHGEGKIYYRVNEILYSGRFRLTSAESVSDEKYTMRYNANNPNQIEIDYWNPVFLPEEKTHTFIATISKIHHKSFWDPTPFFVYTFDINGRRLKNAVYLPEDHKQRFPTLKEGQHYKVECWDKNIFRCVVHLNQPLSPADSSLLRN